MVANTKIDIIPWSMHFHSNLFETMGSRDFHKIVVEIYNKIPDDEKERHLQNFNSMIETWHYQPAEAWCCKLGGIWIRMESYLSVNFPDVEKYSDIVSIFNGIIN